MKPNSKWPAGCIVLSFFFLSACDATASVVPSVGLDLVFDSEAGKLVRNPVWSPTGTELAFTTFDPWAGDNKIIILDLNTGKTSILLKQNGIQSQSWSPDGRYLVYNLYSEIWGIRMDGNVPPEILGLGQVASWSPDGKQIAIFEKVESDISPTYVLKILEMETYEERILLTINTEHQEIFDLSWSPSNSELAFSIPFEISSNIDSSRDIYFYDYSTDQLSQFTVDQINYLPKWSPSGEQIAYLHQTSNTSSSEIIISQVDTSCKIIVPGVTGAGDLAWSPEGRFLAYSLNSSLYVLDLAAVFGQDFISEGPKCP
jgi:Tol biopolymer transport system component